MSDATHDAFVTAANTLRDLERLHFRLPDTHPDWVDRPTLETARTHYRRAYETHRDTYFNERRRA